MRRIGRIAVIISMMIAITACGDRTGNPALDEALWNGWPGPGVGHVEKTPHSLQIAALVHRGGLFPDQDQPAIRATIDRVIRYAARQADERKAPQFDMQFSMHQLSRTMYRGSQQMGTTRQLFIHAVVDLSAPNTPSPGNAARFIVREVLSTSANQQLTLPASATIAPPIPRSLQGPATISTGSENARPDTMGGRSVGPRPKTDGGPS